MEEIEKFKKYYPNIELYFEALENATKGCSAFICTILDIVKVANKKIVILDTSVETHLLDVAIVNMPLYIKGTQKKPTSHAYELAGNSCMQGDVIAE